MGYGRVGGHRKHPAGRGNAGGEHHKRIQFNKYHPGYFGKLGMRCFHRHANQHFMPCINVDKVWSLVPEDQRQTFLSEKSTTAAPVIDVTKFGYYKVLGRGNLVDCPVIVKARVFSSEAEEKITKAGGVPVLIP